jgi:hypothetical protein
LVKVVTRAHLGPMRYHSEPSEVLHTILSALMAVELIAFGHV